MTKKTLILNVAGGKFQPLDLNIEDSRNFIVNVDNCYYYSGPPPAVLEQEIEKWLTQNNPKNLSVNLNEDIFTFMEKTVLQFDHVAIYRFLEHVSFTQVPYFIYLISTVTKPGAIVDIIVPNYEILAERILDEKRYINPDTGFANFTAWDIELTTELLNEPSCPHASIWTPNRARYFWELEKRFTVSEHNLEPRFKFDGRDIYLRFLAVRI
jgi:hypothetical protein